MKVSCDLSCELNTVAQTSCSILPLCYWQQKPAWAETVMSVAVLLVAGLIVGAVQQSESESNVFPLNEVKDCFANKFAATANTFCFNEDCESKKLKNAIVPCLLLGYDLIYQDSSYQLKGDSNVRRMAHCAVEKCAEGLMTSHGTMGFLSGWGDSVYSCLVAMSNCVKTEPKFKLKTEF
ncbi:hypothetical protein AALO_G00272170 [Alosa alosa]|uniref:Uncharacterized protein n=1 Tax=Alosa alosa TaxID=278164 RepID=A0AAV6FMJ9_9TELE|nr:hypothetical protein AALO_G00272170 [Alosa alosa]